jgi:hypothetical protein
MQVSSKIYTFDSIRGRTLWYNYKAPKKGATDSTSFYLGIGFKILVATTPIVKARILKKL